MDTRTRCGMGAGAWCAVLALGFLLWPAGSLAQGVQTQLTPPSVIVAPGSGLDLTLDVTQAGSPFNGFKIVLTYDRGALTFVPTSPTSLQQGCLMTGLCSNACGNTFHDFKAAGDSIVITDILLCGGVLLSGPGTLYELHFTASSTEQITTVSVRSAEFYAGGTYVTPVTTQDATIGIGVGAGVGDPSRAGRDLPLRAVPNPCFGATTIRVGGAAARDGRLLVTDLLGHVVRHLQAGGKVSGSPGALWDGRDDRGVRVPAGVYRVTVAGAGRAAGTRVVLLR